jgi:membrane protein DedA with SNARE-associated domain/membrane-associated phospholipid phosphatase
MMERLLALFASLGHWGYLVVFLLPFLESAAFTGLLVPGETVVVLAGFLSSQGYLDLGDCLVVISLAVVLGDTVGYTLGKAIGRGYFEHHKRLLFLKEKHLQKTEEYFDRHGGKTIFLARFTHFLRAMAPFVAGMSRMPYKKFITFNVAGGILWTVVFTLLGYFFGQSWQMIEKWAGRAGLFILFLFLVIAGFSFLYRTATKKKPELLAWFKEVSGAVASVPFFRDFREGHPGTATFIRQRLSPEGYLGIHLTVGLMVSAVFIWIFGGITEDVLTGDPLVNVDRWVLEQVHFFRTPLTTSFMTAFTALGGSRMITAGGLTIAIYLIFKKRFDDLLIYLTAILGGSFLSFILKTAVHRVRPHAGFALIQIGGWSFPSGHAMMSIIFYGMLAYLFIRKTQSWKLQVFAVSAAGLIVFLIGFSRIYLGVHYLSDVLAGYTGGLFWLTVSITGLETYKRFSAAKNQKIPSEIPDPGERGRTGKPPLR